MYLEKNSKNMKEKLTSSSALECARQLLSSGIFYEMLYYNCKMKMLLASLLHPGWLYVLLNGRMCGSKVVSRFCNYQNVRSFVIIMSSVPFKSALNTFLENFLVKLLPKDVSPS